VLYSKADLVNAGASRSVCRHHKDFTEGDTPLHLAASRGHQDVVTFLLSLKASVIVTSSSGATPLHHAATEGHHQIVNMLLELGANPNAQNLSGRTPLHEAVVGNHVETQQALANGGAESNIKDREGNTPLHEAAKIFSEPLVRLLVANGENVDEPNGQQHTPLHLAIINADHSAVGHVITQKRGSREAATQIVKLLLSLGADANAVDAKDETPLDLLTYLEGDDTTGPLVKVLRANGGQWVRYKHRHTSEPEMPRRAEKTIVGVRATTKRKDKSTAFDSVLSTKEGQTIHLGTEPITIGRSTECNVQYRSLTLSRRHSLVEPNEDGYVITDLGSHNGTVINGQRISQPHALEAGEIVTLGAYEFEFDGSNLVVMQGELPQETLEKERQRR